MTRYTKDPDAKLDYGQDWTRWLADAELINAHTIVLDPPDGLTVVSDMHTTNKVIVWLSGGEPGARVRVTYRITTDQGRIDERTDSFHIQER